MTSLTNKFYRVARNFILIILQTHFKKKNRYSGLVGMIRFFFTDITKMIILKILGEHILIIFYGS